MKSPIISTIIVLICYNIPATAQIVLNRQQCREMALEYSETLQLSQNQHEQAVLSKKIAKSAFFPKIEASGTYLYKPDALEYSLEGGYLPTYLPDADGDGIPDPNIVLSPDGTPVLDAGKNPVFNMYAFLPDINLNIGLEGVTMAGLTIQQPLYAGGKIRTANKMAKTGIDIAGLQVEKSRAEVLAQTDEAFFRLVSLSAKKKAAIHYQTLLDSLTSNIQAAVNEGMATKNDLLKVQVKRNEALLMVQKATNGETLARMNLCRIIGLPLQADISISPEQNDTIFKPQLIETEASPDGRPEYQLLNKAIEIKKYESRITKAGMLPEIGVSAGYHYFVGMELNGMDSDEFSFMALASVKIPIFHWFEEQNKLSKAKLQEQAAQLQLEETEKLIALEIAQAKYNLQDALKRFELTQTALEQATENLETSQQQFEEGLETLVNLLEAQAQWQEALSNHIDAQTSVKLMETKFLKAMGKLN
ncbi:TolC family protein [Thermophagus xiamenensis]|uniref:Outer membrane protein TolC n=1 Tax=Thermophagus xiamenensis TaxID=385682 RepID=A0A1I2ETX9_9BACT|nr:TolC family protein [Thermophagus xiamenensis]SFE95926.1 Outer membrane protein TolC [Thermophagus xiamenensis]